MNTAADCRWLGLPDSVVKSGQTTIDARLKSFRGVQAYLVIANALTELGKLYQGQENNSKIDEANTHCRLVIAEGSRQIWWEGKECCMGLSDVEFRALLFLARGVSGRRSISERDIYSDVGSSSRFPTMISRLKKRLPEDLRNCITSGGEKSTYRLDLPGELVYVAE